MTIELDGISVRQGDRILIRDLTLDISTEGSYLIRADHGSGKTALLRILMGLDKPSSGRIRLLGDYKYTWLACGVVFQEDRLFEGLTAVENVAVIRKLTSEKAALEELLVFMPQDRAKLPVRDLSASERRAVCIVRALSVPADILIMDEPFAGMTDGERTQALVYIRDHRGSTPLVIAAVDPAGMESFKQIPLGT